MAAFKVLTILATLGVAYSQNAAAPVLIWGNHHSIDKMSSKMGEISTDNIEDMIMKSGIEDGKDTHVLIGILETLSLSDLFMKYGNEGVFSKVQASMDGSKYKNFFKPASSSPKESPEVNHSLSDVQNLVGAHDSRKVHIIKINPKGEDPTETLKMADNIMHKACEQHASQYKSYICVMTASSGGQEGEHVRIARSLLQTTPPVEPDLSQDVYYFMNFALVYTKPSPYLVIDKPSLVKYNLTKTTAEPTKDGKTLFVRFQDKAAGSQTFRLGFNFETTSTSWSLESISYGDGSKSSSIVLTPSIPISTSLGNSFHTPSKVVFKNTGDGVTLTFNSLQVEYSPNLSSMRFSLADDTVYFFTIPILSGLFVTSLLVTIVLLGLSMIFDIKTMDLFDDPKGKTVTINASE